MNLDDLLAAASPPGSAADDQKLRAALDAEFNAVPPRSWRGDVLLLVGVCAALLLAIGAVLFFAGQLQPSLVLHRAPVLAALFFTGATCAFAALAPRRRGRLLAALVVAAAGFVGLVLVRGPGLASTAAPWVCTLSHLAVAGAPLVLALALLRKAAIGPARAGLAGLAVGSVGAMLGELACEQGWTHVASWHLGAWVAVGAVALLASRRLVPRSFAP